MVLTSLSLQPETPTEEPKDEEYDIDKLPSLEVKVTSARLRNQKGGFPDHDPPVEHPEITEGKKGGWKR